MSHDLSGAALQAFIDSAHDEWETAVAAERRADPDADESATGLSASYLASSDSRGAPAPHSPSPWR